MNEPDTALSQNGTQMPEPILYRGEVDRLAFIDQRANPIGLPSVLDRASEMRDHFVHPL